jgi:hypothetical protein
MGADLHKWRRAGFSLLWTKVTSKKAWLVSQDANARRLVAVVTNAISLVTRHNRGWWELRCPSFHPCIELLMKIFIEAAKCYQIIGPTRNPWWCLCEWTSRSLMKQNSKVIGCNLWPDSQSECEIPRTVVMIVIRQVCSLFGIEAEIPKKQRKSNSIVTSSGPTKHYIFNNLLL